MLRVQVAQAAGRRRSGILPGVWTCSDNAAMDPAFGSCSIEQEPSPDDATIVCFQARVRGNRPQDWVRVPDRV